MLASLGAATLRPMIASACRWSLLGVLSLFLLGGCADGSPAAAGSGIVTLFADDGVHFGTGTVQSPGNFQDSDVRATSSATHGCLTLNPGGPKPTTNHPVDWFDGQEFVSLEEVPTEATNPVTNQSLVCAETGRGFLMEAKWGGWTRAWIQAAGAQSVTLHFEPVE